MRTACIEVSDRANARSGLVHVRRVLGVHDAGRIGKPMLADCQAIGGMVGGIGVELLEHTVTQGLAAAVVMPASMALIAQAYPDPGRRAVCRPW